MPENARPVKHWIALCAINMDLLTQGQGFWGNTPYPSVTRCMTKGEAAATEAPTGLHMGSRSGSDGTDDGYGWVGGRVGGDPLRLPFGSSSLLYSLSPSVALGRGRWGWRTCRCSTLHSNGLSSLCESLAALQVPS